MNFVDFKIQVPKFSSDEGIKFKWENNFKILVKQLNNEIIVQANEEGLISLARIFLFLSQHTVPINEHVHLDETNSLEKNSCDLIIEKIN